MDEIRETILAMLSAENKQGCGFYTDAEWITQYNKLARLAGCDNEEWEAWTVDGEVL